MAIDVDLQVIDSMTDEKFETLKDSSGKIPGLANHLVITGIDDNLVDMEFFFTEISIIERD